MSDNQKETKFPLQQFKHNVVVNSKNAEPTWKILESAIDEIYNQNSISLTFNDLYTHAHNMILFKYGEMIYSGIVESMTFHIDKMLTVIESAQGGLFLEEVNRKWQAHTIAVSRIREIFMYMERTFIVREKKIPIQELGLNLWRDIIVHSHSIRTRLQSALLERIYRERTGEVIDRCLMKNIINMLIDLGHSVYEEDFEIHFLEDSADFYKAEAQKLIECCECIEYLMKVGRYLDDEKERVYRYLDDRSESKIQKVVEVEMIKEHMLRLVHMENSGFASMLLNVKIGSGAKVEPCEQLGIIYNMISRVPSGIETMINVVASHIKKTGKKIVTHPDRLKDPIKFVQCILNEKEKCDAIISVSFNNQKEFIKALNSSFEYFINLSPRSPEFISLFLDDKLRKGLEDIEIVLDKVIDIFRFLHNKDKFEKYYKQHLSKRLLYDKTVSDESERSLIGKLKSECGFHYTSKLEGMFKDIESSREKMDYFLLNYVNSTDDRIIAIKVLTTGYWPIQPIPECNLPSEVCYLTNRFKIYYLGIHSGRRLSWQTNMGNAYLRAIFGKTRTTKYRLYVSIYQMCVLMLFNDATRLSYKEIEQATKIPSTDLNKCLISLAHTGNGGRNVLRKKPKTKVIGEDDMFKVNDMFRSKCYKVMLGGRGNSKQVSEAESQKNQERLEVDRKPQIEAAIVRIMKTRRVLTHNNVIAEVTSYLQPYFLVRLPEIKNRIESLIDREFLKRDDKDRSLYHYLA
ncbi:cullin-3A-like [Impatiens glandulifera]|uniref:cullin-3A-like n=1 Tax=Impatiens glandulifera TaxID=253017 RepID=UPI001FB09E74|nr:cullin-3A-like [Impatiens glandulifera]